MGQGQLFEIAIIGQTCFPPIPIIEPHFMRFGLTGPRSAVGNVSGYRCEADCRSRGREFLIPAWSHTFVEINHEIISTVILLPSAESFMKGCCQLQAKVCARLLVNCLFKLAQEKRVVR